MINFLLPRIGLLLKKNFKWLKPPMKNQKRTYLKGQLLALVWGSGSQTNDRAVDVCVLKLSKIFKQHKGSDVSETAIGKGYRLVGEKTINNKKIIR